jgi:hypothetical protein
MADRKETRGVSGDMELRYHYEESGNYGQDEKFIRVTLRRHSETEVLMKVEESGGNHFPGKCFSPLSSREYVIGVRELEDFIQTHGIAPSGMLGKTNPKVPGPSR